MSSCTKCGAKVMDDSPNFCLQCGASLVIKEEEGKNSQWPWDILGPKIFILFGILLSVSLIFEMAVKKQYLIADMPITISVLLVYFCVYLYKKSKRDR